MNDFTKTRSLLRELAEHDDRLLLDIGLVRGDDGALRSAADPEQAITAPAPRHRVTNLIGAIHTFLRDIPAIPLKTALLSH
jgi:uncharacterized protein YjiS (DUF1127 family)